MVIAVVALIVALGGTGIAATQLPGGPSASSAKKKKKVLRGPRGAKGAKGDNGSTGQPGLSGAKGTDGRSGADGRNGVDGRNGTDGAAGSPGAVSYGGHALGLGTSASTNQPEWIMPVGFSAQGGGIAHNSTNFSNILSPDVPITAFNLSVRLNNAPGSGSVRSFTLYVIDSVGNLTQSPACTIVGSGSSTCSTPMSFAIPALSKVNLQSTVSAADATGTDAQFSWRAG
jgi:hypothetical protein